MERIAIIGLGCAGYHGVKALREHGFHGEIHVYSDVSHPTANPMLTTYYVAGRIARDRMFPFGDLEQFRSDYQVQLHMDTKVSHIHAAQKSVILEDGSAQAYDQILIATGARAVSPPLGQGGFGRTFLMRTVADGDRLKELMDREKVSRAVVIGASMVGIKVVEFLHTNGAEVHLVDMAPRLFPLACMQEIADTLEADLTARGIQLLLEHGVDHVEEMEHGVKTWLTDGQCLESDILVLCIGTRANTELTANTEVVDAEPIQVGRGIIVNSKMETNIPGIYAAGDCCEALNLQTGKTMIIGLWANAAAQGQTAGINMAGGEAAYTGSIPNNITHYFDKYFIGIGDPNLPGERYLFTNDQGIVAAIRDNGKMQCINILGNYRISGIIKDYFIHQILGDAKELSVENRGLLKASKVPDGFINLF